MLPASLNISENLAGILVQYSCAYRHLQDEVLTASAGAVFAAAAFADIGAITAHKPIINHGIEIDVTLKKNTAAITTIAAIGTASCNILFPPETESAIASLTRVHGDTCFVYELHLYLPSDCAVKGRCWGPPKNSIQKKAPVQ